jgi:DDE superfamily endonuclease
LPVAPGQPAREDYQYERRGVCNLFVVCEPLRGWRDVMVSARRTRIDWAHCIKDLVDVHYPDAEQIVLVQDNLNTHTPASLYEAFPPAEAKRLADRLELHYTPKHGSWLNMAEIEPSVLAEQCLDRRLADQARLEREVAAWRATPTAVAWTGVSRPRMLGSSSSTSTLQFRPDELLASFAATGTQACSTACEEGNGSCSRGRVGISGRIWPKPPARGSGHHRKPVWALPHGPAARLPRGRHT